MKYLIKSNLLVIASAFVFPFIYFTMAFDEYSYIQTLLIIIAIFEAILVKLNYDFINYDHDIKYRLHSLPKWFFYGANILCNIVVIASIIFLKNNFKYFILLSLLISNGYHILFNKSKYTLPILALCLNAPLCIIGYSNVYFIVLGISIVYSIALAYYLNHLKTKVYTYDNY